MFGPAALLGGDKIIICAGKRKEKKQKGHVFMLLHMLKHQSCGTAVFGGSGSGGYKVIRKKFLRTFDNFYLAMKTSPRTVGTCYNGN